MTTRSSRFSKILSVVIAVIVGVLAILYLFAVLWCYRLMLRSPRPLNKTVGLRLQRYAPFVYAFLVFSSLIELALSIWLLLQFGYNHNVPTEELIVGLKLLLFCSCWTFITGSVFTILFIHPIWSKLPLASIGVQGLWIVITWCFWVAGAATVNSSLPALFSRGICFGLVYCGQIQTLFAISVLQILTLASGMLIIIWLVWRSTRDIILPPTSK